MEGSSKHPGGNTTGNWTKVSNLGQHMRFWQLSCVQAAKFCLFDLIL